MMNTIGISRSLINKFTEMKKKNPKLNDSGGKLLNEKKQKYNLLNSTKDSSNILSTGGINSHEFVDIFEKTNRIYNEIEGKFIKLQEDEANRLRPRFNEDDNMKINKAINSSKSEISKNLAVCEGNIMKISLITCTSKSESNIKNNMRINLANKLKELTSKIRKNEEIYMVKYKDLGLDDSNRIMSTEKSKTDFLEMSMTDNILNKRDVEINDLVRSINDLGHIFKEISNLVNEQGTILDRIDYNIESAITNTVKANEHLKKTEQIQEKSNCVRNSIMALIAINFILGFILILKFFK